MKNQNITYVKLPSGTNVRMSVDAHDNHYLNFTESQYFSFSNCINGGLYFPQIMQFIFVLFALFNGCTDWWNIILCNILCGVFFTLAWFWLRLYYVPGLALISCLIGGNIFRFFLHFVAIAIIAFFVLKNWVILLACVAGGLITTIIKTILYSVFSTAKYNDRIVKYISSFEYKE